MKQFFSITRRNFSSFKVINPYTQQTHREYKFADPSRIKDTIDQSLAGQQYLSNLSIEERCSLCRSVSSWFDENAEKVALEITNSMGKPLRESHNEIKTMKMRIDSLVLMASNVLKEDVISMGKKGIKKIKKEPVGTGVIISPWNYPLLTTINPLISAILCGNSVILKHSVRTPRIGDYFASAFAAAGAQEAVQHFLLEDSQISELYNYSNINFVCYTGSIAGGRTVQREIADSGRFIKTVFELGGKDPAYVRNDADINFAAASLVDGATYNAGQSCVAVERIYVDEEVYEKFLGKCLDEIDKLKMGNPLDEKTTLGPMCVPDSLVNLMEQVDQAVSLEANVLTGGRPASNEEGNTVFFEPTLLSYCTNDMRIVREESFGPVIPTIKVTGDDEALGLMNDSDYGLSAAIYTQDSSVAEQMAEKLDVGTVFMNRCDYPDPELAHTGRKTSGCGVSLSKYGFETFYRLKSYNFNNI